MPTTVPKKIVVLGGGFAGVAAIHELLKELRVGATITLINKHTYHVFTPSLYEVATSESPQKNIAIPFSEIFSSQIDVKKAIVERIDDKKRVIATTGGEVSYDFLIICLGSESAYHHIEGLKEHSIPLKTLHSAVMIQDKLKELCQKEGNGPIRLVIGGGGFAGVELAAELLLYKKHIEERHIKKQLDITIIQGSDRLLKELDKHVSDIAQKRLEEGGVHFAFGGHITGVSDKKIETDDGKSYEYDLFIWTGGIEANHVAKESGLPVDEGGRLITDEYLQVASHVFAAGDIAGYIDPKTKKGVPTVAQVAQEQGAIAGKNVARAIAHQPFVPYHFRHYGYIVPLKGRFAAAELMGWMHFDGLLGWILQQLVFLRYLLDILPFTKALKRWNTFELDLDQ